MMLKKRATPGPWVVADDGGEAVMSLDSSLLTRQMLVATLPEVNHANAYLIAAAPELLKTLEEARRFVIAAIEDRVQIPGFDATKHVTVQQIDAAIEKARGK